MNFNKEYDKNIQEILTQTPYSESDIQKIGELKKDIIKGMYEKNPISKLRNDMLKTLLKFLNTENTD